MTLQDYLDNPTLVEMAKNVGKEAIINRIGKKVIRGVGHGVAQYVYYINSAFGHNVYDAFDGNSIISLLGVSGCYKNEVEIITEKVELSSPTIVYPNHCKLCKSPSRKCGKVILCSNTKCKTRKNFNKQYRCGMIIKQIADNKVGIEQSIDKYGFVLCPTCKNRAQFALNIGSSLYDTMCPNGHMWKHHWENGQKRMTSWGASEFQSLNYTAAWIPIDV